MSDQFRQFVLLPARGLRGSGAASRSQRDFFYAAYEAQLRHRTLGLASVSTASTASLPALTVIDSIHEDGAKLVEADASGIAALRAAQPGIRVVPLSYYELARAPRQHVNGGTTAASTGPGGSGPPVTVTVTDATTTKPLQGVVVVAFTDFAARVGAEGRTDASGTCSLQLPLAASTLERLYVYPKPTYWGALRTAVPIAAPVPVQLARISLAHKDALQHHFPNTGPADAGIGVRVAVIDSGIDTSHPDLTVSSGLNTVVGEDPSDFGDNGEGHGTHVAGIICGRTAIGESRTLGLAPGATLHSYRVFGLHQKRCSNYSVAKAIDRAISNKCDILNLSLSASMNDDAIEAAIDDAYHAGILVIAAAGNDGRKPVGYPAALTFVLGVSALGRKGTFPEGTVDDGEVSAPFGTPDADDFIALFSNVGDEIDLTAPGVGIVSTVPVGEFGAMSGTSMAAPTVTGYAARLLSVTPDVLSLPRDAARADAMMKLVLSGAKSLGLSPPFEGRGLPR